MARPVRAALTLANKETGRVRKPSGAEPHFTGPTARVHVATYNAHRPLADVSEGAVRVAATSCLVECVPQNPVTHFWHVFEVLHHVGIVTGQL